MPIYEYRCTACGCEKEYLQKISEPLKTDCPECGKPALQKKVTAAGFQLKGSGWYVTDFRDSGKKSETKKSADADKGKTASTDSKSTDAGASSTGSADTKKSDTSSTSTSKTDSGSGSAKGSSTTSSSSS